jgi:pyrroline-5-carboxylate reductase
VKPQVIEGVLNDIAAQLGESLVVSIAAGISCARLESLLPAGTAVVRVMPNTPAMVGQGMAVVSGGSEATDAEVESVRTLFAAIGEALVVEERYQNAASAISGSGPAYFALVVDALARAGVAAGLTRQIAQALAVQTMLGTAEMLRQTGLHPEALIDGVTSPGGTTIAALGKLESAGLRAAFDDAVRAAVARAQELGER